MVAAIALGKALKPSVTNIILVLSAILVLSGKGGSKNSSNLMADKICNSLMLSRVNTCMKIVSKIFNLQLKNYKGECMYTGNSNEALQETFSPSHMLYVMCYESIDNLCPHDNSGP